MADKLPGFYERLKVCCINAERCSTQELKALWNTVADSYRYLIDVEERSRMFDAYQAPDRPAPSLAVPFADR